MNKIQIPDFSFLNNSKWINDMVRAQENLQEVSSIIRNTNFSKLAEINSVKALDTSQFGPWFERIQNSMRTVDEVMKLNSELWINKMKGVDFPNMFYFDPPLAGLDYLKEGYFAKQMNIASIPDLELNIVDEVNTVIDEETDSFEINEIDNIYLKMVEYYLILTEKLNAILVTAQSEKSKNFVINTITLLQFFHAIWLVYNPAKFESTMDQKNMDIILNGQKKLEAQNDSILRMLDKKRISIIENDLKFSNKKKCKILGRVRKGQEVTILNTMHKYLFVYYIDFETQEPKAGYVLKKHYKR